MIGASVSERLDDLLADEATQGLGDAEREELEVLLAERPDVQRDELQWIAAALDLPVAAAAAEPLPEHVRRSVEIAAIEHMARQRDVVLGRSAPARASRSRSEWSRVLPWLAAAAALALAAAAWWPRDAGASPASRYARLIDEPASERWRWADNEAGATGEVVWNASRQEGVLKVQGLPVNDPREVQYQLWIFDAGRAGYSDANAVDGGVFDVERDGGAVYVPIRAKLPVSDPSLFAVTTEPPGGVVKHNPEADPDRYRLVLTAPAPS